MVSPPPPPPSAAAAAAVVAGDGTTARRGGPPGPAAGGPGPARGSAAGPARATPAGAGCSRRRITGDETEVVVRRRRHETERGGRGLRIDVEAMGFGIEGAACPVRAAA